MFCLAYAAAHIDDHPMQAICMGSFPCMVSTPARFKMRYLATQSMNACYTFPAKALS